MATNDSTSTNPRARYSAYLVQDAPDGSARKPVWHRVATVFPHDGGDGFNVDLPPGMSITGRLVIRRDLPRDNSGPEA